MILPLCLLAIVGLGHCQDEPRSTFQIEESINRTIDEVERLIREDPKLPRLSRADIVDILFNITSTDVDAYTDKELTDKARADYQRALMVVLPYNPNPTQENITDLYTKAPMIQMIPDETQPENFEMVYEDGQLEEIVYPERSRVPDLGLDSPVNNFVVSENSDDSKLEEDNVESTGSHENHRDTYSAILDPIDFKSSSVSGKYRPVYPHHVNDGMVYAEAPERFSFNLNNLQMTPKTTEDTNDSFDQESQDPQDSLSTDTKLQIVYSTTVSTKKPPTTKIAPKVRQEFATESTTVSTTTTHRHVLTSGQWHYNAPPTTTETLRNSYPEFKFHAETSSPGSSTQGGLTGSGDPSTTTRKPEVTLKIKGHNREKKRGDGTNFNKVEEPSPIYVTPMTTSTVGVLKNKFSSSYAANAAGSVPKASTSMPPMRSEVKDLLASIGLFEGNPDQQSVVGSSLPLPGSNNLIHSHISALQAVGVSSPSISSQNTFENANYDFKKGTQNLTPDMQLLLQTFGLQASKLPGTPATTTKKPTPVVVNLNSYSKFRPLPTANVENQDMRDFLAKFGLGDGENEKGGKGRGHKSIKTKKNSEVSPPSLIEAVPDHMKKILENIGLISRSQKSTEYRKSVTSYSADTATTPKLHVFKPHEAPVHTEEQKEKINVLLDTVKKVQLGMATSYDVQSAAKDLLETTKTLQNGPDPLSLDEILTIYNEGIRNEAKRQNVPESTTAPPSQEDSDTSSTATETATTAPRMTTIPTTTTEATIASEASNIAALQDSFGGSTQAPDSVLPMQRKTGLYFLVDWNTFLEVGEEGPDRVNLRFQPKVGDRTRFIPVTVP